MIDTLNIGIGAGFQAIYAGRLIEQGLDMEEICRKIQYSVEHTRVYFCLATLEYLRKGGRIGRVASMLGSVLNLKPIISCDADGAYYVVSKARGRVKSIAETVALALKQVQGQRQILHRPWPMAAPARKRQAGAGAAAAPAGCAAVSGM